MTNPDNFTLLKRSFLPEEWDYLLHNLTFKELSSRKNKTLKDFFWLLDAADLLLRQRSDFEGSPQYYFGQPCFRFTFWNDF